MAEHDYAVKWAVANRDLVARRIKECIFPTTGETQSSWLEGLEKIIDMTQNSVKKHPLTLGSQTQEFWVYRKGALPADLGIVLCPGSRGDFSWLLRPTGDGQLNDVVFPCP